MINRATEEEEPSGEGSDDEGAREPSGAAFKAALSTLGLALRPAFRLTLLSRPMGGS